jgi:hypothetical protein
MLWNRINGGLRRSGYGASPLVFLLVPCIYFRRVIEASVGKKLKILNPFVPFCER